MIKNSYIIMVRDREANPSSSQLHTETCTSKSRTLMELHKNQPSHSYVRQKYYGVSGGTAIWNHADQEKNCLPERGRESEDCCRMMCHPQSQQKKTDQPKREEEIQDPCMTTTIQYPHQRLENL